MAPDHFWLSRSDKAGGGEAARLRAALGGRHVATVDISDSRTVFAAGGPAARDLLASGTGIDLHPRAFHTGAAALTRFASLPVLLTQTSDTPAFELFVERAAEDYVSQWLSEAKRNL